MLDIITLVCLVISAVYSEILVPHGRGAFLPQRLNHKICACIYTESGVVIQEKYIFNSKKSATDENLKNPGYVFPLIRLGGYRFCKWKISPAALKDGEPQKIAYMDGYH